jgi:hypothetical protein
MWFDLIGYCASIGFADTKDAVGAVRQAGPMGWIMPTAFFEKGWCRFPYDPVLARWVEGALPAARAAVASAENAGWWRSGGTWFVGVNVLPNDGTGRVGAAPPLAGEAVAFVGEVACPVAFDWDRAQVSVCRPGYPRRDEDDTEARYRFRRYRDAAHLDGLRREGAARRRHLREHHGFLLGIPMVTASDDAAPLVVWEGSHDLARRAFHARFGDLPPESWGAEDVTEVYHRLRRTVFETCRRVAVVARPGEAYLVHRLALHGMAPWEPTARAGPDGRMIVYFRPTVGGPADWLNRP